MWQVIINGPGYFDTQYELPEGVTSLGRADENDIVLSGDLVSRRHARIEVQGGEVSVEDLGSRNGCRVNGEPLKGTRIVLKVGDTVTVGENSVAIRQPAAVENARTEVVHAVVPGVRRFAQDFDVASALVVEKSANESELLRALDNVMPFTPGAEAPVGDGDKTPRPIPYPSLALLYKTAEKLATARSLPEFLEDTADRLMERVNGTTAVVLLRQPSGTLVPAAVRHRGTLSKGEVPVSDAIIEEALRKKAALAVAAAKDDERFATRDSVVLYNVDQVLCIPIGPASAFVGVLYLNCSGQDRAVLESLLDACNAVGHLIAAGVEKFRVSGVGEDRLRKALERFHAPQIVEQRIQEIARQGGGKITSMEEKTLTALFADIAGFTQLTHKLSPAAVVEILDTFYRLMSELIFSFEGTVDKFMGDSVMALFGAPYSKGDDAVRAVRTALAMRAEWQKAMTRRPPKERCALRIGINTGKALAGTIGAEARLDYTAIGEPVNVASWVSETAAPGQVLITGKTLAAIGARFDVNPLGERALRGPQVKEALFEVVEEDVGAHTHPGVD
jgi:adenylate cyclase